MLDWVKKKLAGRAGDVDGQTLIEYVLILVLIAVVIIIMVTGLGSSVNNTYSTINNALP